MTHFDENVVAWLDEFEDALVTLNEVIDIAFKSTFRVFSKQADHFAHFLDDGCSVLKTLLHYNRNIVDKSTEFGVFFHIGRDDQPI